MSRAHPSSQDLGPSQPTAEKNTGTNIQHQDASQRSLINGMVYEKWENKVRWLTEEPHWWGGGTGKRGKDPNKSGETLRP
ncbi:hypothetical protein NPIL_114731 [Nephila pilipes]|uniref:Uncharacterized protein n=1 Tax=Nephila pilipes TaxID=299642 RepID=A0A8X6PHR2_NEPPI|nr:hypothetical protein NPIL_114731 [Nephila pilipes]